MKQFLLVLLALVSLTTGKLVAQTVTSPSGSVSVIPGGSFTLTKSSSGWSGSGSYSLSVTPTTSNFSLGSFSGNNATVTASSSASAGSYTVTLKKGSTSSTNTFKVYVYTIDAGSDQTITLPTSSVSFTGASVTNGTAPAATSYSWTQTSGPATASISNATSLTTASASGLTVAGTYVFRLTINGNSSLYNELTVTVNQAPSATMSPSPVTITPGSVSLTTSASNFPGSGNYSYSWSASPSSGVTLPSATSTGNSTTKTFSFTTTGTYIITATVTRSTGTATVNDTVYVVTSGTKAYGTPVYSSNIKGGHAMIGNTILASASYSDNNNSSSSTSTIMNYFNVASNGATSIYGNDNSDMEYVNIDNGATSGIYNSSSADLSLPSGTNTIKFARLYWGGHLSSSDFSSSNLTTVKIKNGTGNYGSVTIPATQVNVISQTNGSGNTYYLYQSYADITNFVQSHGQGTYTLANIPVSTGKYSNSEGGAYGGWTIVIAYENTSIASYYSIRIYDAFLLVAQNSSAQTVTLSNLNAPNNTLTASDAYLSTFAWEGDANLAASSSNNAGDYLQINGHTYSDAINPATNMWNGTISNNGSFVTSTNPNYKNQMGIDIDQINVGANYGISSNTTSVTVTFGTEADQYYPSVFAFSIKMKDPLVTINKTVTGSKSPVTSLFANETLTYVISGQNTGAGDLAGAYITDTLPSDVTYVPGTIKVYSYPSGTPVAMTDVAGDDQAFISTTPAGRQVLTFYVGTGATSSGGGVLAGATSDQYKVQFQATTPSTVNA
ncbi:MAG: DUF11 domain-containing protein, partial [Bacteroidetes bacterium]|nr:DUF11 domain-containing protein [Bacteroidota bacterium]